jgi:hypothetical protein
MPKTFIKNPWFSIYRLVPTVRPALIGNNEVTTQVVNYYLPLDIIQENDYFLFIQRSHVLASSGAREIDISTNRQILSAIVDEFGFPVFKGATINEKSFVNDFAFNSLFGGNYLWLLTKSRLKVLKDYYYKTGFYPRLNTTSPDSAEFGSFAFMGKGAFILRGIKDVKPYVNNTSIRPDLGTIDIAEDNSFFIYQTQSAGATIKTSPAIDPLVTPYTWDLRYAQSKTTTTTFNYTLATTTLAAGSTVIGSWQGGTTGTAFAVGYEFAPADYLTYEQDSDFATLIGSYAMASGTAIVGTALLDQVLPVQTQANDLAIYTQLNTAGTPTLPASYEQIASGSFEYDTSGTAYYSVAKKTIADPENEYLVATVPNTEATFLSVYRYWDSVGSVVVNLSTGTANRSYQAKTEDYETNMPYTSLNVYGLTINPVQLIFSETKGFDKETDILASNATTDGSKISGSHFTYKAYEIQTIPSTQFAYRDSIEPAGTAYSGIFPAITISVPVIGSAL